MIRTTKHMLTTPQRPRQGDARTGSAPHAKTAWRAIGQLVRTGGAAALSALVLVCVLAPLGFCAADEALSLRPGLRNSRGERSLNEQQLKLVLDGLRHKTGFLELRFDESGFLTLGDRTRRAGGSATARELLIAAVDGNKVFELENHHHSPHVAFAQIKLAQTTEDLLSKARIEVWRLHLDFADFTQLRGSQEVRAAFDLGINVLHELGHGVLKLRDATDPTQLGACEQSINRIRRELGLPERQHYAARGRLVAMPGAQVVTVRAELIFVRVDRGPERAGGGQSYLTWEAAKVAGAAQAVAHPRGRTTMVAGRSQGPNESAAR